MFERGCFACICIEIDLDQLVVGRLWIKNNWYKVEYEGLHLICNSCGCYGHLGRDCKVLSSHGVSAEGMVADEPRATTTRGDMNNGNGSTVQAVSPGIESEIHGDWLTVTKVRKPKNDKGVKLKKRCIRVINLINFWY
jgi:hypothetical protein